ncbi:hypothetical protein [Acidovorax facilis]|uniref:hypothetical protein n=1 Tax=Acidovorax facilis TaxID=12917 RepID=UPI003D65D301
MSVVEQLFAHRVVCLPDGVANLSRGEMHLDAMIKALYWWQSGMQTTWRRDNPKTCWATMFR